MSRFRRRLMGLAALRQAAADDFVRVEYIENTSNAYIDTLYRPSNNTSVEVKLKYIENLVQWKFVYGVEQPTYRFSFLKTYTGPPFRFDFGKTTNMFNYELVLNQLMTIKQDRNKLYIDDVLIGESTYTSTFRTPYNLYIFTCNQKGKINDIYNNQQIRLYGFKIWENDVLIRDYIPMYQISTDTYGLWDRVNEEFYTSPNGVKFTGGERVIADANENLYYLKNYVNVSNNQRKDLGFQPVGNDSWEGKFYFIGTGRQDILGAWNSQGQRQFGFMGIDNHQMRFLYNTQTIYNTLSYGNKTFTLKAEKNKFYIYDANNKLIWNSSAIYTSGNNPVRNFIVGHLNGSVYASNARMYYFKYMRGDNLVWDLIPVQRCSDKVWGLFCKVHNSFYESSGGTAFTGG